jgi:hypothetical protein
MDNTQLTFVFIELEFLNLIDFTQFNEDSKHLVTKNDTHFFLNYLTANYPSCLNNIERKVFCNYEEFTIELNSSRWQKPLI